jgi:cysteine-rich repeat protein
VCAAATPLADGTSCGADKICRSSTCVATSCGDGFVEAGEECDDGNQVDGDGCDATCKFSCKSDDATRNCALADACQGESTCNDATHVCSVATPLPVGTDCTAAASPAVCQKLGCSASHACEVIADPSQDGMQCDATHPTDTCNAGACILPLSCGNGVLDPGEQCDDGDLVNLDGCDSECRFEQVHRITSLEQQFVTDSFCTKNALGAGISVVGQGALQFTWDESVADGSTSVVFKFLGLTDLTGQNATVSLGFVNASPAAQTKVSTAPVCGMNGCEAGPPTADRPAGLHETGSTNDNVADEEKCPKDCSYDGNNDLDQWYVRDPASVDDHEVPKTKLDATITSGHLVASGDLTLNLLFVRVPSVATLHNARVEADVGPAVTVPTTSTTGVTPGHLPSEHLASSLTSFASSANGQMCAQLSAASLASTPIAPLLIGFCATENFTATHTFLDAFVAGCINSGLPDPIISATQPDGSLDGSVYAFQTDTSFHVTTCTRDGVAQPDLTGCLQNATYSSYFKFQTDRVIIKRTAS